MTTEERRPPANFGISEGEMMRFGFRTAVRRELEERPENFWLSPDIAAAEDTLVYPGKVTSVTINLPHPVPPFTDLKSFTDPRLAPYQPLSVSCAYGHTRSRFAQLGLHLRPEAGAAIAETIEPIDDSYPSRGYRAIVWVQNYARRPILLHEGTRFFNLYYFKSTITGSTLRNLVGSQIKIDGVMGRDWRFWSSRPEYGLAQGIEFLIDPKSRRWVEPSDEPMTLNDGPSDNHNRAGVDNYLSPAPKTEERIFWIAGTVTNIELDRTVNGLTDRTVKEGATHDLQTNSLIIAGGNTTGKLRTEIYSPTREGLVPTHSLMKFSWS